MRSTFKSNLKRKQKAEQNGTNAKIIWPHFSRMMFLAEIQSDPDENCNEETNSDDPSVIPSSNIKWTLADEENLIDFYQANEELWNHRLPSYKLASKSQLSDEVVMALDGKFNRN